MRNLQPSDRFHMTNIPPARQTYARMNFSGRSPYESPGKRRLKAPVEPSVFLLIWFLGFFAGTGLISLLLILWG